MSLNDEFLAAQQAASEYANDVIALQEGVHVNDVIYLRNKVPHINQQWQSLVDEWIERNIFDD